jgi:hypothetical protein
MSTDFSDVLTNEHLPKTSATLTIRVIKSFEYRTEKSLVVHRINLETMTVADLKATVREGGRPTLCMCLNNLALNMELFSCKNTAWMEAISQC